MIIVEDYVIPGGVPTALVVTLPASGCVDKRMLEGAFPYMTIRI